MLCTNDMHYVEYESCYIPIQFGEFTIQIILHFERLMLSLRSVYDYSEAMYFEPSSMNCTKQNSSDFKAFILHLMCRWV